MANLQAQFMSGVCFDLSSKRRIESGKLSEHTWAAIRKERRAAAGEYDEAIQPLRDGIWKLVTQVREKFHNGARGLR